MKKQQGGFTLIELIMVIVILGILAAVAIPKFADLSGDAKIASIKGLSGALNSAAVIAHSAQLAKGDTLGVSVILEGATVLMVNGYPQANADGIGMAASVSSGDYDEVDGGAAGGETITYTLAGNTATNCEVTYTSANAGTDNTAPLTAAYTVVAKTDGC